MPAHHVRKRKNRTKVRGESRTILRWFILFALVFLAIGVCLRFLASWQNRIWVGDSRITFVSVGPPVKLLTYQPSHELVSIAFPEGLEINSALGLGNWKVENLYELGRQKGLNGAPLVKSLEYSLNIPIDGFLAGDFSSGLGGATAIFFADTNFTFFDKLKIAATLARVSGGETKVLSAQKIGIVAPQKLADGSKGYKLSSEKLKIITNREFQDSELTNDKNGVGIINGTSVSGAGDEMAGLIKTMGAQVVWVRAGEFSPRCVVHSTHKTITAEKISKLFDCPIVHKDNLSAPVEFIIGPELALELPRN